MIDGVGLLLIGFVFPHRQILDWNGLVGRFSSSSYSPTKDSRSYPPALERLRAVFERNQVGGAVEMTYRTECTLAST